MDPKNYFTVTLYSSIDDTPQPILLGKAWRHIHQVGAKSNIPLAVSFPRWMTNGFTMGDQIRVFTETEDQASTLKTALDKMIAHQDLAYESEIYKAKKGLSKEIYLMHRLPPAKVSKNQKTMTIEKAAELQERTRLRLLAQQRSLPFVWMRSSTGNKFKLVVERFVTDESNMGVPNGYGLSRATQLITLPIIP